MKKLLTFLLMVSVALALPSAAFASVQSVTFASQVGDLVTGPLTAYAPLGDPAWASAPQTAGVVAWDAAYPNFGANYISDLRFPTTEYQNIDSWRLYHREFTVGCAANGEITGVLKVNSDNAEEAYFNGELVGTDGYVNSTHIPQYHEPGEPDVFEWTTVQTYSVTIQPGLNTMDFIVRNYASTALNPTSLAYKLDFNANVPDAVFLPPVTNDSFTLLDGSTLPVKFSLSLNGALLGTAQQVYLEIEDPNGAVLTRYDPGDGSSSLRFDPLTSAYIANFQTKNFANLVDGGTYTAVIRDGCSGASLGSLAFQIFASNGTGHKK